MPRPCLPSVYMHIAPGMCKDRSEFRVNEEVVGRRCARNRLPKRMKQVVRQALGPKRGQRVLKCGAQVAERAWQVHGAPGKGRGRASLCSQGKGLLSRGVKGDSMERKRWAHGVTSHHQDISVSPREKGG